MDSSNQHVEKREPEGISLKELIHKVEDIAAYVWKKKLLVILFGLIGGGLGVLYSYLKKPLYLAELTFVLEDSKSNSMGSSYLGLASQFGLDISGGSGSGAFSGDNILELLKSKLLVEKALLTGSISSNGKDISLADRYLEFKGLREDWAKVPELANIHYPLHADRDKFSLLQDSVLKIIGNIIIAKNLKVEKTDKKLDFISVKCQIEDERFSKLFVERLVAEATNFYIDTKTKRNKTNVDRLQLQADSLEALLNKRTYSAAAAQDLNTNPAKQVAGVGVELALRNKMVSQTMYGEVIKNLELSKISMAQETPVIQIVDKPILPLEKKRFGKLMGLVIGGIAGGFLYVMFLMLKKVYLEIMS
ncbi:MULTISPECIES: Wzz/FepE/Etk N-terminal domain-containing protein [unclassified Chitinophaga]|uniref:Wzz/FepE/Etk N-terminal domain-containing protein n=1 Tax=unclassified Chitinophaga TaxID=2619133 RepID=UPI00300FF55E